MIGLSIILVLISNKIWILQVLEYRGLKDFEYRPISNSVRNFCITRGIGSKQKAEQTSPYSMNEMMIYCKSNEENCKKGGGAKHTLAPLHQKVGGAMAPPLPTPLTSIIRVMNGDC